MTFSDPIADLLTRVRNGSTARLRFVEVSLSKMKLSIVKILKQKGFIDGFLVKDEKPQGTIRIYLRYGRGRSSVIQGLERISRPSCRIYAGSGEIPHVFGGLGVTVVSTSQGVMDGGAARNKGIGGELLCKIW